MKKLFFMLIATICVAGAYAQNMQIWTGDDIMYEQSVATIDSITFTQSSAPEQEETLYKTWSGNIVSCGGSVSYSITISNSGSFTWSTSGIGGGGRYACYGNIIYFYTTTMEQYACGSAPLNALFQNGSLYLATQMGSAKMY